MIEEDLKVEQIAFEYIRSHAKEIIDKFCPPKECYPVKKPVTLFMAGSPGAGKTEISKGLINQFLDVPIRIDADEIRALCPNYNGANAHLFQKAANKGVNLLYDFALKEYINCIMDGTFAYKNAKENIERSLKRGRAVEIWFIHQDPIRAWEFTKARETQEARHVSKEIFIKALHNSRDNVREAKEFFGKRINLNILIKDYEADTSELHLNTSDKDLDRIVIKRYPIDNLEEKLT